MIQRLLFGAAFCAVAVTAHAQRVDPYVVLFQGEPGGALTTTVHADGSVSVEFSYRDNGRGPDVKEQIVLDRAGGLRRHTLAGASTFGGPIDEAYVLEGATARWHSVADRGEAPVAQPSWYWPISESSPEGLALAVRAALTRPGRRLPMLPSGEAVVTPLLGHRFRSGKREQAATLYAVTGLDYEPEYIWLTDGPNPRFFALVIPGWMQVVPAGWEAIAAELDRLQIQAQARQLAALVPALAHRVQQPILIRNARVFDSERARLGPAQDVYVNRGRIAALYPAGAQAREAATVIDAGGRVLLPALFDMHDHMEAWSGLLQIAGGVTTVRDMGNDNAVLADQAARIDAGEEVGPRVVPAGFIEGQSEHAAKSGIIVSNPDEVRAAVDWYAQRGYPQLKLYNSYRREWVAETTRYAHERGLRVSGHVPAFMRAEEVVRLGYDELQHINQVMLNFLVGPQDDTRTLLRFYRVMEKAHELDLGDRRTRQFLELLRERGTVVDPTAATFEDMYQRQGEPHPAYASVIAHLPATVQRYLHMTSFDVTDANVARYKASYDKMLEMIGRLHRAGVPLVAGTDTTAGLGLHRELELYVKAGIPAPEVLRIATWNGAKVTRTLDRLGSVTPGKLADLILVEGDPTANISDIRRIGLVMKEGVIYYPSEVFPAVGVKPFTEPLRYTTAK
jgi:cytosine/adenosine deaminase-related metal-dependent hydrolase